jgi:RecB family exonuclease
MGLLGLLETQLGLGGILPSLYERAAALMPHLRETSGYWRDSFDKSDALGVAQRLIKERDYLMDHGWRGEPLTDRLRELRAATEPVLPGPPDRWLAVLNNFGQPAIASVKLFCERVELSGLVTKALGLLEEGGVAITVEQIAPSAAQGDLAAARAHDFEPVGDGSLQLIRPFGVTIAARAVAAWLAAQDDGETTVIIGADRELDRALHEHGLPTAGASHGPATVAAVLPLTLELAWGPQDPQQAYELLMLPGGPIPRHIGARLVHALQRWPSTESEAWTEALEKALGTINDEGRRERTRARIRTLFAADVQRHDKHLPIAAAIKRIDLVEKWANGAAHTTDDAERRESLHEVLHHIDNFRRLVASAGLESFTPADLRRWLRVSAPTASRGPFGSRAGLEFVDDPAQVVGPADNIIWWSFNAGSAPTARSFIRRAEREALAEAGCALPSPAQQAATNARLWQRPLLLARKRLVCVCPQRGLDGQRSYPHPLWDEVVGRLASDAQIDSLVSPAPFGERSASTRTPVALKVPRPTRTWTAPAGTSLERERESPSSLETSLGCSLQWALSYFGDVDADLASAPPGLSPLVMGSVAHRLYEALIAGGTTTADDAETRAAALFDEMMPKLAASFLLPGAEAQHGTFRYQMLQGARALMDILSLSGATVRSHEEDFELDTPELKLRGRADLVLQDPDVVVDYKWGRGSREDELRDGTALQLAVYAKLVAGGDAEWPAVAYFILSKQDAYTNDGEALKGATHVQGPALDVTWSALLGAVRERRDELGRRLLVASAIADDVVPVPADKRKLENGKLVVPAKCEYCSFGSLCGALWGGTDG